MTEPPGAVQNLGGARSAYPATRAPALPLDKTGLLSHSGLMTQTVESPIIAGRWWALAALALTTLTISLDTTVLNVALPTLATALDATTSQLQWFGAAYTLVIGALVIPMGVLGDRLGRKRVLLAGVTLFGLSSAICAFASSVGVLIAARTVQGVGGAAIMSLSLAMLPVLFTDRVERTRAMNTWVTCSAVGMPLGPIVGGWLLNHYDWGSVFLINVPMVLAALLALTRCLPETRSAHPRPVDLPGIALSSAGLVGVIYGLITAGQDGWSSATVIVPIVVGVVLLAAFAAWEVRSTYPIVDLSLFTNRDFMLGMSFATVANFSLFGLLFVMPQYFQDVRGADPFGTGVRLLPMIGGLAVATRFGPALLKRTGARIVIILGLAMCAVALGMGSLTDVDTGYALAAVWITILGAGIGLTLPASMTTAMTALSAERAGSGSGLLQALRQMGGTIGVAVLGTVLTTAYHSRLDDGDVPSSAEGAARASVGAGIEVAHRLGDGSLEQVVRGAFIHGMDVVLLAAAAITLLSSVLAALLLPRRAGAIPVLAPTPQSPAEQSASELTTDEPVGAEPARAPGPASAG